MLVKIKKIIPKIIVNVLIIIFCLLIANINNINVLAEVGESGVEESGATATHKKSIAIGGNDSALNKELAQKKERINQLQEQINEYQKNINYQRQQSLSLSNQLNILSTEISKLETEIELKNNQIETTKIEIKETEDKIKNTEKNIATQKSQLSEFIKTMNRLDQKNVLEILLTAESFSDYYNHLHTLSVLENNTGKILSDLKTFQANLETNKAQLETEKKSLENFLTELDQKKESLEDRSNAKKILLKESRNSEAKFSSLVTQLKAEQSSINNEIVDLEKKLRKKLSSGNNKLDTLGDADFIWPSVTHIVTAYFHDPDYPFRYIFEHPATDIKSPQGSPVKAASSGYVGTAKDAGMGYNYIMLIHGDGFSTVYGHLVKILIKPDQFVNAGDIIGLSGGMPGTPGAGRLSTGPHLHFEIRKNGIPVNPLDYLP